MVQNGYALLNNKEIEKIGIKNGTTPGGTLSNWMREGFQFCNEACDEMLLEESAVATFPKLMTEIPVVELSGDIFEQTIWSHDGDQIADFLQKSYFFRFCNIIENLKKNNIDRIEENCYHGWMAAVVDRANGR